MIKHLVAIFFAVSVSKSVKASEIDVSRSGDAFGKKAAQADRENRIREIPHIYGFAEGEYSKQFKLFHTRSNNWTLEQIREKTLPHRAKYYAQHLDLLTGLKPDLHTLATRHDDAAPPSELDDMSALDGVPHELSHRRVRYSILEKIEYFERDLAAQFKMPVALLRMCIPYLFEPVRLLQDIEDGIFDNEGMALPLTDELAKAFFVQLGTLMPKRGYEAALTWSQMTDPAGFREILKYDNNIKVEMMDFLGVSTTDSHLKKLNAMNIHPKPDSSFTFEFEDRPWLIDRPSGFGDPRPYMLNRWTADEMSDEFDVALNKVNRVMLELARINESRLKSGLLNLTLEIGRMLLQEAMHYSTNYQALAKDIEFGQPRVSSVEEQEALNSVLKRPEQKIVDELWVPYALNIMERLKPTPLLSALIEAESCRDALKRSKKLGF